MLTTALIFAFFICVWTSSLTSRRLCAQNGLVNICGFTKTMGHGIWQLLCVWDNLPLLLVVLNLGSTHRSAENVLEAKGTNFPDLEIRCRRIMEDGWITVIWFQKKVFLRDPLSPSDGWENGPPFSYSSSRSLMKLMAVLWKLVPCSMRDRLFYTVQDVEAFILFLLLSPLFFSQDVPCHLELYCSYNVVFVWSLVFF